MVLLITFLFFVLAVAGLSLGVLMGREPLRGSCGGSACARCRGSCERAAGARTHTDAGDRRGSK